MIFSRHQIKPLVKNLAWVTAINLRLDAVYADLREYEAIQVQHQANGYSMSSLKLVALIKTLQNIYIDMQAMEPQNRELAHLLSELCKIVEFLRGNQVLGSEEKENTPE